MPACKHPRGEIGENDDAEHDVEHFREVVRRQEGRRDDEQDGDDIEGQQPIAESDTFRRRAFIEASNEFLKRDSRHGAIFAARTHHCK